MGFAGTVWWCEMKTSCSLINSPSRARSRHLTNPSGWAFLCSHLVRNPITRTCDCLKSIMSMFKSCRFTCKCWQTTPSTCVLYSVRLTWCKNFHDHLVKRKNLEPHLVGVSYHPVDGGNGWEKISRLIRLRWRDATPCILCLKMRCVNPTFQSPLRSTGVEGRLRHLLNYISLQSAHMYMGMTPLCTGQMHMTWHSVESKLKYLITPVRNVCWLLQINLQQGWSHLRNLCMLTYARFFCAEEHPNPSSFSMILKQNNICNA